MCEYLVLVWMSCGPVGLWLLSMHNQSLSDIGTDYTFTYTDIFHSHSTWVNTDIIYLPKLT